MKAEDLSSVESKESFFIEYECDRVARQARAVWVIESTDGFKLYREDEKRIHRLHLPSSIVICWANGSLFVQGKRIKDSRLAIVPINGTVVWKGGVFTGSLSLIVNKQGCLLKRYSEPVDLFSVVSRDALDLLLSEKKHQKKEKVLEQVEAVAKVPQKKEEQKERALGVKVLLAEESLDSGPLTVVIPGGKSWALDPYDRERFIAFSGEELVVERRPHFWLVNGKRVSGGNHCWIRPEGALCGYHGITYHGSLLFVYDKGKILVINCLELEAYIGCVLYAESWPGWPLEINKVMAVACRTYALSMIADARQRHKLYHIKNTNIHQMYEGAHSVKVILEAVDLTRGLFLSYKNRPIRAMFDSCCGGIIPAKVDGFDFVRAPYLARTQQCLYCKSCKIYGWEKSYSLGDLASRFSSSCLGLSSIVDIAISRRNAAGIAKTITLKDKKRSYSLSGKKVYSLLREVKSFCYSITKKETKVTFKGRGYGHHMGLCQWGAREMVNQGYSYRDILSFYYPGVTLMRL